MAEAASNVSPADDRPARGRRLKRVLQWLVDHREQIRALLVMFGVKFPPLPPGDVK